jgi:hypothetical protein
VKNLSVHYCFKGLPLHLGLLGYINFPFLCHMFAERLKKQNNLYLALVNVALSDVDHGLRSQTAPQLDYFELLSHDFQ